MKEEEPQNDFIPDELMEDEEVNWPNDVNNCQDLVYRIAVFNNRQKSV